MGAGRDEACIGEILRSAASKFADAGIENGMIDAELLLGHCLDKTRTELYLAAAERVAAAERDAIDAAIARRCRREPVAYIIGEREFWSYPFLVTPAVLIPRPETEFLVEHALSVLKARTGPARCLDLCCGSGAIGIVLALETGCRVIATDISQAALAICRENIEARGVSDKVFSVCTDLAAGVDPELRFDLVTANPPYVTRGAIETELEPDVADYEPVLALDGGEDGLDLIRRIAAAAASRLKATGHLYMEIGYDQGVRVSGIFLENSRCSGFKTVEILKDYAGRDRVVHVCR